jgi:hypothetical protein
VRTVATARNLRITTPIVGPLCRGCSTFGT